VRNGSVLPQQRHIALIRFPSGVEQVADDGHDADERLEADVECHAE
jgi:hypothetical protein